MIKGTSLYLAIFSTIVLCVSCASKRNIRTDSLTLAEENQIAKRAQAEIQKVYRALPDPEIQNYVSALGTKLVEANELSGHPYSYNFIVLNSPTINAFGVPAGTVYVTSGLLTFVESEAELAGVLAHEIAHIVLRHASRRKVLQEQSRRSAWAYGGGGALAGGVASTAVSSVVCPLGGSCSDSLILVGAASGLSAGLFVQKFRFLAHSREDEFLADDMGFEMATRAGYSVFQAGDFLRKLSAVESQKNKSFALFEDALNTHPNPTDRAKRFEKYFTQIAGSKSETKEASQDFARIRARLLARDLGKMDAPETSTEN